MKRYALYAVLLLFVVCGAFAATRLTINPSDMKNGETKTFTDDGRKVTVHRDGDTMHVTIEGANGTRSLSITNDDGAIHIDGFDGKRKTFIVGPDGAFNFDGKEFTIPDFKEFKGLDTLPRHGLMPKKAQTWFVCPKDHTMLRVPDDKVDDKEFKCPVDGTTMEKRKGRGFAFFFDDDMFESHDL
jgi:hypothetical protein